MAKKLVLDYEEEAEYSVIGISSQLPDYRLIFYVNKVLNMHFKRIDPFFLTQKNESYSMYLYEDDANFCSLYFLSNRSNGIHLFNEFSIMDYLIFIRGDFPDDFLQSLISSLKSIQYIQISNVLNTGKVKNYYNTIFDFENHIQNVKTNKKDVPQP